MENLKNQLNLKEKEEREKEENKIFLRSMLKRMNEKNYI